MGSAVLRVAPGRPSLGRVVGDEAGRDALERLGELLVTRSSSSESPAPTSIHPSSPRSRKQTQETPRQTSPDGHIQT